MNKEEILAKYKEQHDNLSEPYYQLKRQRAKALRLYLTPVTLVETAQRRVLKQLPEQAQLAVRQAFEDGQHRIKRVVTEYTLNSPKDATPSCSYINETGLSISKPSKRFSDLTSPQKEAVWQMILDEDEFNYTHQDIQANCNAELKVREEELKAKPNLTIDEEEELEELKQSEII